MVQAARQTGREGRIHKTGASRRLPAQTKPGKIRGTPLTDFETQVLGYLNQHLRHPKGRKRPEFIVASTDTQECSHEGKSARLNVVRILIPAYAINNTEAFEVDIYLAGKSTSSVALVKANDPYPGMADIPTRYQYDDILLHLKSEIREREKWLYS